MALPASFLRDGFKPLDTKLRKFRRMMIGTEGESESGKTEFMLSAPGPGIIVCLDRGFEGMLLNPKPPQTRCNDYAFSIVDIPLQSQVKQDGFVEGWNSFKSIYYKALGNADALTVGLDTDSASWELQQLAEFGKIAQVPPLMRTGVKAARRAMIARAFDSGKNVIGSNMLKDEYVDDIGEDGAIKMKDGKSVQKKTGERTRQGFPDQDYLWQVQLRHLVKKEKVTDGTKTLKMPNGLVVIVGKGLERTVVTYGIEILKCKFRGDVVGDVLWAEDCCFAGLVQHIFPDVKLKDWGF